MHLLWGELDKMFIGNCNKDLWLGMCCYASLGFIMKVSILIALTMRLWHKPHYNLISWITKQKGTHTSCVKSLTFINVRSAQGMGFTTLFNWLLMWPLQGGWEGTGILNQILTIIHYTTVPITQMNRSFITPLLRPFHFCKQQVD